ncbi:hypothetical protein PIB30_033651 [Stylosanthes scabra]|uniref:DUF4283 domain-containing protein n=1 Tax=Stylosanthes scabra TaxID=79078 RepID=A0ABU6TCA0_9FABA|nr:hypothetical protein [Stylosanthes scabra]
MDRPPDGLDDQGNGANAVVLAEEDISESFRVCAKSLIGRIIADRTFSVGTMESSMDAIWSKPAGFRVADLEKWREDVSKDEQILKSFPLWVQFWGLPEQFKTLEVGHKVAKRIGEVLEVDLFEVKGKENQIVKARVELNWIKKIRDSISITGLSLDLIEVGLRYERLGVVCLYCAELGHTSRSWHALMEDSQRNRVRHEALGEWIKVDQVGRRIFREDFKKTGGNAAANRESAQPEKKPPPDWLTEGLSNLNLKETWKENHSNIINQTV